MNSEEHLARAAILKESTDNGDLVPKLYSMDDLVKLIYNKN